LSSNLSADIVTDRLQQATSKIATFVRLFDEKGCERISGSIKISKEGKQVAEGQTRDEKYDFNDFLIVRLAPEQTYHILVEANSQAKQVMMMTGREKYQFCEIYLIE
jgi:hypothetical protein